MSPDAADLSHGGGQAVARSEVEGGDVATQGRAATGPATADGVVKPFDQHPIDTPQPNQIGAVSNG